MIAVVLPVPLKPCCNKSSLLNIFQGEKGDTGGRGPKGDQGITGPKGQQGNKGDQGNSI